MRAEERRPLRDAAAVCVAAQAKVNLRLRILAREASGFHQLETLLLRLELADTIRVRRRPSGLSIDVGGESVAREELGPVEQNLAWRAAVAWREAAGGGEGFAIELEKRVPVGGGLGGGSADAGAVLRALDAMSAEPLGEGRLMAIAARLGADVPFLTSESPYALAWGRGERLLPLPPLPSRIAVLFVPPFRVNTAEAYRWLADSRSGGGEPDAGRAGPGALAADAGAGEVALSLGALGDWAELERLAVNDFEPVVAARHPEVAEIVGALRSDGSRIAMLSGSGSTVFGILPPGALRLTPAGERSGVPRGTPIVTRTASRVEPISALD